jgi:LCP family protein required for cell wall assembly
VALLRHPLAHLDRLVLRVVVAAALRHTVVNRSVGRHLTVPQASPGASTVLLVGGSDRRRDLTGRMAGLHADVVGGRADAIVLVGVIPALGRVRVLSVPRNVRVEVPVIGSQKLGWALDYGGASLLTGLVAGLTGLPVHHYVELDFQGFTWLVDAVGGASVTMPAPRRDSRVALAIPAGEQRLDGWSALALARSRHPEPQPSEHPDPVPPGQGPDLARTERQQQVIAGMVAQGRRGLTARTARMLLSSGARHLTVDDQLTSEHLVQLATILRHSELHFTTLPVRSAVPVHRLRSPFPPHQASGAPYLDLDEPAAGEILRRFRTELQTAGSHDGVG